MTAQCMQRLIKAQTFIDKCRFRSFQAQFESVADNQLYSYRGRASRIRPSFGPVSPDHNHGRGVEFAVLEQETTPLLL
jgi:hypothetical protein